MANLNKVLLIGNLTKDPELRYTPSGTAVANLRMAINRKFKDRAGELKDEVCFINVVTWDKQAEVCNQYLHKGSPLFVEGRLQSRSWDGPDGKKRSVIEVRAERIQFLSSGSGANKGASQDNYMPTEGPPASTPEASPLGTGADEVTWGQDSAEDMS
jgi:single-strand DNA-binding protein